MKAPLLNPGFLPEAYSSENTRKYTSQNPLVRRVLRDFIQKVSALVQQTGANSILDVGCGEGFMGHFLARQRDAGWAKRYLGVDGSEQALQVARKLNPQSSFFCMALPRLGFKENCFDLVLCLEVLEHLPDPVPALAELHRVSSQYCLISVPHEPFFRLMNFLRGRHLRSWGNHPEHVNHWNADSFRKLLSLSFTVQELHRSFPWLLALCRRERDAD